MKSLLASAAVIAGAPHASAPLVSGGSPQFAVGSHADAIAPAKQLPLDGGLVEVRAAYSVPGMSM